MARGCQSDHARRERDRLRRLRDSMPILYFGDSEAYRRSPLKKVAAVGLNPSAQASFHEPATDESGFPEPAAMTAIWNRSTDTSGREAVPELVRFVQAHERFLNGALGLQ